MLESPVLQVSEIRQALTQNANSDNTLSEMGCTGLRTSERQPSFREAIDALQI